MTYPSTRSIVFRESIETYASLLESPASHNISASINEFLSNPKSYFLMVWSTLYNSARGRGQDDISRIESFRILQAYKNIACSPEEVRQFFNKQIRQITQEQINERNSLIGIIKDFLEGIVLFLSVYCCGLQYQTSAEVGEERLEELRRPLRQLDQFLETINNNKERDDWIKKITSIEKAFWQELSNDTRETYHVLAKSRSNQEDYEVLVFTPPPREMTITDSSTAFNF